MEVTRKGLAIIGIITVIIITVILFITDMYITKLDEQARADLFNENVTMTDSDIFNTPPADLTKEQIDRLYELANTTSTDPADVDLARRANAMLMRTMSTEDALKYGSEWEEKRLVSMQDVKGGEIDPNYEPEEALESVAEEEYQIDYSAEEGESSSNESNKISGVYKSLTDGEYHDEALDDKVVTVEELISDYGITEEDLVNIPER